MGKPRFKPEKPAYHELTSYCTTCHEKLWIKEILANYEGLFQFQIICLKCGCEFMIEITADKIKQHCWDMDFCQLIGAKLHS